MADASVRERVKQVMAGEWGLASRDVPDDAALNRFERWDSLGHISLLLALQREFGLELNPDSVQRLGSLASIVAAVAARTAVRGMLP